MSNEEKAAPDNYYPFRLADSEIITYLFQTDSGLKYEIRFKHSPYLFKNDLLSRHIYEFSLALLYKPPGYVNLPEILIAPTVITIFLDFYQRFNDNSITVYICDSSDFRQHVRKRKFDLWFDEYNTGAFIKLDEELKDSDGTKYPVAIIIKRSNPYRLQIFEEFVKLTDSYNDAK